VSGFLLDTNVLSEFSRRGVRESTLAEILELCGKELGMFADRSYEPWDGNVDRLLDRLTPEQYTKVIEQLEIQAAHGDPIKLAEFRAERKAIQSGKFLTENARQIGGTIVDVEAVKSN
jgi:hypothetical protein